jgi:hypothetical protein
VAKVAHKLTAKQVVGLPPGLRSDGGNLYLRVRESGSRQFVFLYRVDGKRREMGLGGAGPHGLTLAQARHQAERVRAGRPGPAPGKRRRRGGATGQRRRSSLWSVRRRFVSAKETGWKNEKRRAQ